MSIISCTSPRPFLQDLAGFERHKLGQRLLRGPKLVAEQPDQHTPAAAPGRSATSETFQSRSAARAPRISQFAPHRSRCRPIGETG
jgi:hypothetical protein